MSWDIRHDLIYGFLFPLLASRQSFNRTQNSLIQKSSNTKKTRCIITILSAGQSRRIILAPAAMRTFIVFGAIMMAFAEVVISAPIVDRTVAPDAEPPVLNGRAEEVGPPVLNGRSQEIARSTLNDRAGVDNPPVLNGRAADFEPPVLNG